MTKKTTKIEGYSYDNGKKKFRVRITNKGFIYYGGYYKEEVEAIKAVKKLSKEILEGTAIPGAVMPSSTKINSVREKMLEDIKKANGVFTIQNRDEMIESFLKDTDKYKQAQKRLNKAKEFSFKPDTDEDIDPETITTIEPEVKNNTKDVKGLTILDRIYNSPQKSLQEAEEKISLSKSELDSIVSSAVSKALSEVMGGIQGNQRSGRKVSR